MVKVLGIKITDRIKEAGLTQGILSKYSHAITTRLGFHEVTDNICSREAYIVLHMDEKSGEAAKLREELEPLGGILIREMIFDGSSSNSSQSDGNTEILGILVARSNDPILPVQKILTLYGCNIRTRLGVNESFFGDPAGLIILELTGDYGQRGLLVKDLAVLPGVQVQEMRF